MQLYHPTKSTAIVYAAQIIDVLDGVTSPYNPLGWRALRLQGHNIILPTPEGWQEQHKPKPGDYLVQDTEGRAKIVPEALFLGAYHRASPADDSEHPAWPIRTHADAGDAALAAICASARARGHEVLTDGQRSESVQEWAARVSVDVPADPACGLMEEGRETTFENLAAEMDECGATGWASRVRQLGARVAPQMLHMKGEFSQADIEAFKAMWTAQSRMPLIAMPAQPVDVVPGLMVITECADKMPEGCSVTVLTLEGEPWMKYVVKRQWFEDYKPQVGGGLVPVEGGDPLYYPPGSFKPALPTRVTKAALEAMFASVAYEIRPDGRTTVCEITFKNGFSLRGEESCIDPTIFRQDIGEQLAYEKALNVAWGYAGFLLMEDRHRAAVRPIPRGEVALAPAAQPDVAAMVNRFLGWKLPIDFCPDAGVSFSRTYAAQWGMPSGTNLFNAEQAKAMFEYCLKG